MPLPSQNHALACDDGDAHRVPTTLLQEVVNYLQVRPYCEVAALIGGLQAQAVPLAEAAPVPLPRVRPSRGAKPSPRLPA